MSSYPGAMWQVVVELVSTLQERPELVRRLVQAGDLQRGLHEAMGAEYDACARYDGECDVRVLWVREVIAAARVGQPKRETESWSAVEYLLDARLERMMGERGVE